MEGFFMSDTHDSAEQAEQHAQERPDQVAQTADEAQDLMDRGTADGDLQGPEGVARQSQ